jgi:hypothetical protein
MSEIKVNKISPRTACGTVTLGDSGDTIALGAGASQTGFGRTGTVDWQTTKKTGDFTAANGEGYFVDSSSTAITVTLPSSPSAGNIVSVSDYNGSANTNSITIARNGSNINGDASNFKINKGDTAITFVYVDATVGWTSVQTSSITDVQNPFIVATGGATSECGNCKIHKFTGPGTFTVSNAACTAANNEVSYVIVAGGGGGGGMQGGGGGGAGGYRESKSPVTSYTASPLDGRPNAPNRITVTATAFPITVGAGGAAAVSKPCSSRTCGVSGSNSQFSTIIGAGGGGGGLFRVAGIAGGSGGGGGGRGSYTGGAGNTPPVTPPQGQNGGTASCLPSPGGSGSNDRGGGGGGAGAVGGNAGGAPPSNAGNGGNGVSTGIDGVCTAYAGGGGGGIDGGSGSAGTGGTGGGAAGATNCNAPQPAGGANTGGGGGGAGTASPPVGPTNGCATAGGSGIVIIRYKFQ